MHTTAFSQVFSAQIQICYSWTPGL